MKLRDFCKITVNSHAYFQFHFTCPPAQWDDNLEWFKATIPARERIWYKKIKRWAVRDRPENRARLDTLFENGAQCITIVDSQLWLPGC